MKLILTSAGFYNSTIVNKCVEMVGKPADQINFAIINEAYAVEHGDHFWVLDDLNRIRESFKGSIEFVNLLALNTETIKLRIEQADVIFVLGGNTDYLMHVFQKSGFDKILPELLHSKVYVGSSAGAMVLGKRISTEAYERVYGESGTYGVAQYLNYLDIALKPHMGSKYFPNNIPEKLAEILADYQGITYGLTDDAAVIVDETGVTVIGGEFVQIENGSVTKKEKT